MKTNQLYLDNNSSAPVDPRITQRLIAYLAQNSDANLGNPSSVHSYGKNARKLLEEARRQVAQLLNVRPNEIIFTSGGTEGMHMLISGIIRLSPKAHVISSSAEHTCTLSALQAAEKGGWSATYLSPGEWGAVTPEAVLEALKPDTKLICLMAVNNETGVKTDIEALAKIAASRQIPFIVDGVALLGKELWSLPEGVSAMAFSGHKIHALQGTGFAFVRSHLKLSPLLTGGSQEFGRRAGTENLLGILSLGQAASILSAEGAQGVQQMLRLRNLLEETLMAHCPKILINGAGPRICNVSNLAFPEIDGESLLIALDQAGIAASHGSACASGALEPSHVLLQMGLHLERVRSSVRFSFSRLNSEQEVDAACAAILNILMRKKSRY